MRILIVDDKEENRYMLETLFRGNGYETISVSNGAEALEELKTANIDLIISDILMPVMDGFELCRKIRANNAFAGIPFIVYTATYTGPQDEEFAIKIGADRFIIKPSEPDVLLSAVREAIGNKQDIKVNAREHLPEQEVLKLYNERLVRKLEQKMQQLEKSEELFRNLFQHHAAVKLIIDPENGKIVDVNEAAVKYYGWPREDFLQMNIKQINTLTPEEIQAEMKQVKERKKIRFEFRHRIADGSIRDVEVYSSNITVQGKNLLHSIIFDITEKKHSEKLLQKTRLQLELFIEHAPSAIAMFDNEMKYIAASNRFLEDYNLVNIDVVGKSHYELFPDIPEKIKEVHRRCLAGAAERSEEDPFLRSDGRTDWIRWEARPWYESPGETGGIILFSEVITARKEAEISLRNSEERLRHAAEAANFGTYSYEFQTGKIYYSPEHLAIYGLEPDDTIELDDDMTAKALYPDDKVMFLEAMKKTNNPEAENPGLLDIEFRITRPDGELRWLRVKGRTTFDAEGKPMRADGIVQDVTEHKLAAEALRESQEQYRLLFENSLDGVFLTVPDGTILSVNRAGCDIFGRSKKEILKLGRDGIIDSSEMRFKEGLALRNQEGYFNGELTGIKANGERFPIEVTSFLFTDHKGRPRTSTIIRDITERKRAEEKIHKLNRTYAVLSEINKTIVHTDDQQKLFEESCRIAVETGGFIFCWIGITDEKRDCVIPVAQYGYSENYLDTINISLPSAQQKATGPTGTAIKEKKYNTCNDIESDIRMKPWRKEALKRGYHSLAAFPLIRAEKTYGVIVFYSAQKRFFDDNEEILLLEELSSDISYCIESLEHEKQKQKVEQERDRFFNYSIDMMCIIGADGYFKQINPAWEKILGWPEDELLSKPFIAFVHPEDVETIKDIAEDIIKRGEPKINVITRYRCRDGSYKWLSWNSITIKDEKLVFAVVRDITEIVKNDTEKKKLEAQLIQAQKMESLGTMAGGIAHDFNNILNIIMGYASLLKANDAGANRVQKEADIILDASRRGAGLVKQLLTFARKTESIFEQLQVNDIITEIQKLLKETFPKTIEIKCALQEKLPAITGDSTQIHQVLLNLCVNARDAMENSGKLTITTIYISNDEIKIIKPDIEQGEYIEIQVQDTGSGVDETVKQKIFDPFFTTKEKGKGTGLGLALVYGIVKSHGGSINLTSELGKGTTFYVYLPAHTHAEEVYISDTKNTIETVSQGTGTILIVEDEKLNNELLKRMLVVNGYGVIAAYDGLQGITAYQNHRTKIAAVISDIGLPKLGGEDVFKQIKIMNPKAKIILASGFIDPEIKARLRELGANYFIQKPYLPEEILRTIKQVLED